MASDLATALLSGNATPLAADPAMASIIPQLSLAQALTQQGLSGEPAYPMQAIGRLASALAGIKMMNEATGELSNVYGRAAGSMSKVFPEDTPLGRGLRSDDPYVRMQALQQASKAMLLNSEKTTLGPDQRSVLPSGGGGVPVAAGSPAQAAATEAAKNGPLIARAAGEAGARAPYESGGKGYAPGGPSGLQEYDQSALERAEAARRRANAMPPAIPAPPAAKPPVVVKPSGVRPSPGFFSSSSEPAYAAAAAPEGARSEPGLSREAFNDRFGAAFGGKPVETPEYAGRIEAEKGTNKEFVENSTKNYEAGQNLMGRLTTMDHNIDALGPRWMGAGANAKGEFGNAWNSMLDSAGVKGFHIDPNKIATWQEFNKESVRAGMELIKSNFGGSREAASIIQMGANAVPSAQQSYLGAKYNLSSIRAATQRELDLHEYKTQLLRQGRSLIGADVAFNKEHPPAEYAMRGIVSVIPKAAINHLAANPTLAQQFDERFGAGTARFVLGGR